MEYRLRVLCVIHDVDASDKVIRAGSEWNGFAGTPDVPYTASDGRQVPVQRAIRQLQVQTWQRVHPVNGTAPIGEVYGQESQPITPDSNFQGATESIGAKQTPQRYDHFRVFGQFVKNALAIPTMIRPVGQFGLLGPPEGFLGNTHPSDVTFAHLLGTAIMHSARVCQPCVRRPHPSRSRTRQDGPQSVSKGLVART